MHSTAMGCLRAVKSAPVFLLTGALTIAAAQRSTDIESPQHKAWDILQNAATSKITQERADGVRALGLLRGNARARATAEYALKDGKPEVRAAAATALGQMHATESTPKLQAALSDQKIPVVMAAANALREMKDSRTRVRGLLRPAHWGKKIRRRPGRTATSNSQGPEGTGEDRCLGRDRVHPVRRDGLGCMANNPQERSQPRASRGGVLLGA